MIVDKIDSGALLLKKQEIPIAPFILHCVDIFFPTAKEKGINLHTFIFQQEELSISWPIGAIPICNAHCIDIDVFKINQVIRNIVSNALKFSMAGGSVTLKAFLMKKNDSPKTVSSFGFPKRKIGATSSPINDRFNTGQEQDDSRKINNPLARLGHQEGFLRIQITDSGVGIDNESQKRMFVEIFQFDPEFLQGIFR